MSNTMKDTKNSGLRQIFDVITKKQGCTRLEISEETGISLMTVGKAVEALTSYGLVTESRPVREQAGRRAGCVMFNSERFVIVIDLSSYNFHFHALSLTMNEISSVDYYYNRDFYYEENLHIFLSNIKEKKLPSLDMSKFVGCGVITTGQVENETISKSSIDELNEINIKEIIQKSLGINNILIRGNAALSGEEALLENPELNNETFAYLHIGDDISLSFFYKGELISSNFQCAMSKLFWNNAPIGTALAEAKNGAELLVPIAELIYLANCMISPKNVVITSHKIPLDDSFAARISDYITKKHVPKCPDIKIIEAKSTGLRGIIIQIIKGYADLLFE